MTDEQVGGVVGVILGALLAYFVGKRLIRHRQQKR